MRLFHLSIFGNIHEPLTELASPRGIEIHIDDSEDNFTIVKSKLAIYHKKKIFREDVGFLSKIWVNN